MSLSPSSLAQSQLSRQHGSSKPNNADGFEEVTALAVGELLDKVTYLKSSDVVLLRKAIGYADAAHTGQKRKNGDPYITHPITTASICADWKLDVQALMAALMHDTMEDCGVSKADIADELGNTVADMVDGLTKLQKLEHHSREDIQAESFRKMLLAASRDVRVILIKLADRLHNMRTMADMPRSKWARIAKETQEVFAPIAHRLGLAQVSRELEELSFQYHHPWRHRVLSKAVVQLREQRQGSNAALATRLKLALEAAGVPVQLLWRERTVYAMYRKMRKERVRFASITDLFAYRIIVPEPLQCYQALGILHQLYKPVPGRFRDFIALPKENGYQSLHTMVLDPAGLKLPFQVRTQQMHTLAQAGIAAPLPAARPENRNAVHDHIKKLWSRSLLDIAQETKNPAEFWRHVKLGLAHEELFVFTPKHKVIALPKDATALDFAYAIGSSVGDHAVSAWVNGMPAELSLRLRSGDVVKIITQAQAHPHVQWLDFVQTGRAIARIRSWLKKADTPSATASTGFAAL